MKPEPSTLETRLKRIAEAHGPDTEMMLYLWPNGEVCLHVGNPSSWVSLGEVDGENLFSGKSVSEAVTEAEKYYFPVEPVPETTNPPVRAQQTP
jgi:hypothetical protein